MPLDNQPKKYYLICYDIVDTMKRAKLADILTDYGIRVQKSVFEALLNKDELAVLLKLAEPYITLDDTLRVYELTNTLYKNKIVLGIEYSYDPMSDVIL